MRLKTFAMLFVWGFGLSPSLVLGVDSPQFSELLIARAGARNHDLDVVIPSGGVFAAVLRHSRAGEVAVAGAARIPVTIDFFIARLRAIESFKSGPAILGIGRFSDPPHGQNLAHLSLQRSELDALAACRPGKCNLKLSEEMINRLRGSIPRVGPGAGLEHEFRSALLDYVSDYTQKGTPAMIVYNDDRPPVQTSAEFIDLLRQFGWLNEFAPPLFEALQSGLPASGPQVDHFLYWSKEKFGLKPVISVTHVMILRVVIAGRPWAFVGSKQIYADHYFEASLGLTVLTEESADPANPSLLIAYFNRSQSDGLRGWLGSLQRAIVERRARSGMVKNLTEMKMKLSVAYRAQAR